MKTYTLYAQKRNAFPDWVPLKRWRDTKDNAMETTWQFSKKADLCDAVLTLGSKHVVTYRNGVITALNGKEHKA